MRRTLIFVIDIPLFGSRHASFSDDRNPGVDWELSASGVRLRKGDVEEFVPWSNVAKLRTVREDTAEAPRAPAAKK